MLLCTQHHRLVHEGGFNIEKDYRDRWFFRRPDGRAVPACGYRAADMTDEDVETADEAVKAFLAGADAIRTSTEVSTVRDPSAEVREPSAVAYAAREPSAEVFLSSLKNALSGSGPTSAAARSSP